MQNQAAIYGKLKDGRKVKSFTIANGNGMIAEVIEYGAILTSLVVPARDAGPRDVTHGYDDLAGWLTNSSYFGATVGRYGNRIAAGRCSIDGTEHRLVANDGANHLHGGEVGFDKVLWQGKAIDGGVELTYMSRGGEQGYPGNLSVTVTYTLNELNELGWAVKATTDKATPINIVQHTYWNLSADPSMSINDHELTLAADYFLAVEQGLIPTGQLAPVEGSPFDFTRSTVIGTRIDGPSVQLQQGHGYDHCWVLRAGKGLRFAARLSDLKTGRAMEVYTDQPGMQFYSGNFLDGTVKGKGGIKYARRSACCLESQVFPDSPNRQADLAFPDCILRPGEIYTHRMVNRFSW